MGAQAGLLAANGSQDLEAAHVRAHQKNALAIGADPVNQRLAVNANVK